MNIHSIYGLFLPFFRRKRLRQFTERFHPGASTTMVDVGGYPWCWSPETCPAQITFLNLNYPPGLEATLPPGYRLIKGDGRRLPFDDGSFEIAYSNSVIEHLGTWEKQIEFAREISRVGRRLWVQTPARGFFIEPHLMAPLVHYFPKRWQRHLLRHFTVWGWVAKPSRREVDDFLAEVRLLSYSEMRQLFPDCQIHRERFLGLTKSYIALK